MHHGGGIVGSPSIIVVFYLIAPIASVWLANLMAGVARLQKRWTQYLASLLTGGLYGGFVLLAATFGYQMPTPW